MAVRLVTPAMRSRAVCPTTAARAPCSGSAARCLEDKSFELHIAALSRKTQPCAPPIELIGCLLDVTQCAEVKPGGSCPVSCRFPYTGWSSVAVCRPAFNAWQCLAVPGRPDNVDSEVGLLVVEPQCTLTCEDPPNEPEGYVLTSQGWSCAEGYGGTVTPMS